MTPAFFVAPERCSGCGLCAQACPQQAIVVTERLASILPERCTNCGICQTICRRGAIQALPAPAAPVPASQTTAPLWQTRRRARYRRWRAVHLKGLQAVGLRPSGDQT